MTSPVTPASVAENFHLVQGVLPGRRVEGQEHGVRRGLVLLLDDAHDLGKLRHQLRLVLQPAGRVDEQNVAAVGLGLGQGVEGEAGGVGALGAGHHRRADALAPDLELLDGGGAEGVAGGERDGLPGGCGSGRRACRWWWSCRCR